MLHLNYSGRLKTGTTTAILLAAAIGFLPGYGHADASRLSETAKSRIEADGTRSKAKSVEMVDVRFEAFDLSEISLDATAFAALNRSFESLHKTDFVKYVAANRRLDNLRRDYAKLASASDDPVIREATTSMFRLAMLEVLRAEGLTKAEFDEIGDVILANPDLLKRFEDVKVSLAYRSGLTP